jgi:hypothetical protein
MADRATRGRSASPHTARVRGLEIEQAARLHLDDDALIDEITIWIRPLTGLAALAAALGPRLGARNASRRRPGAPVRNGDAGHEGDD